jgi:hypothetical protein
VRIVSRHGKELRRLVRDFLGDRESFWAFHEEYLTRWTHLPPAAIAEPDRTGWNEIYGWILTAIPDPVTPEDSARGVIGEAELRERLERHPLLAHRD